MSADLAVTQHASWFAPVPDGADYLPAPAPSAGDTSTLIQNAEETGVWYVGAWGDCQAQCDPPVSTRELECRSRIDHTALNESACAMWGVIPQTVKKCSCPGVEICANSSLSCAPPQEPHVMPEKASFVDLGCFPLKPADTGAKDHCASKDDVYDLTCFNETDECCQSGFPFFRTCGKGPGPITCRECFDFCVERGLDIASIVQGRECRCGASDLASKVWRGRKHRNFFMGSSKAEGTCPLRVLAYSGHYVSGAVPVEHFKSALQDLAYMDSIVTHVLWPFQAEEDVAGADEDGRLATAKHLATNEASTADTAKQACVGDRGTFDAGWGGCATYSDPQPNFDWCFLDRDAKQNLLANQVCEECKRCTTGLTGSPTPHPTRSPTAAPPPTPAPSLQPTPSTALAPGWKRSCYPGNCGAGRGPWRVRQDEPPEGVGAKIWESYTIIPYKFEDVGMLPVDAERKEVFRSAAMEFAKHTCIVLQEVTNTTELDYTGNYISVQVQNNSFCSVLGGPGYGKNIVNLGTCCSMVQRGNVVHEIGHAIGMMHEQQRQDAAKPYHGYGPHLNVRWDIISDDWIFQYLPDDKAYIGSESDGDRDPYTSGYMPYDFGSIMHYPVGSDGYFSTINAPLEVVVGQRAALSDGDILQLLDLYQCIREDGLTAAPTPAPVPPEGLLMTGFCGYQSQLEGKWDLQGLTQDGRPYYSRGGFYIYFDACCNGKGVGGMWIIDNSAPALDRATDLDGDGSCTFFAYQFSWEYYPPAGTTTWFVWCGGTTFGGHQITVVEATPAPTLPPGATPSPPPAFPSVIRLAGFCPEQQNLNVDYDFVGYTASGMAYYKEAMGAYIYYDPACDGVFFESAWIIDTAAPDVQAQSDLDNDGACNLIAWFPSPLERIPMGSTLAGTAYCGDTVGWSSVNVIFTDLSPTAAPTPGPTSEPTPTSSPTAVPSAAPSMAPTPSPTAVPSASPTMAPTSSPTATPSASPTAAPTASPTDIPSASPTTAPTPLPQTAAPSASPTAAPTPSPTAVPSASPTSAQTPRPRAVPSASSAVEQMPFASSATEPMPLPAIAAHTGAPTPAPRAPPKVVVDVAVQGVNHKTLLASQAALSAFTSVMQELFASLAGPSIEPGSVDILIQPGEHTQTVEDERKPNWEQNRSLRQGSILVTGEITVPDTGADAADQLDVAEDMQQALQVANISEKTVEVIKQAAEEDPTLQSAVQTSQLQATADVKVVTASPTAAPTPEPTSMVAPVQGEDEASATDDPHVANLAGERFDIAQLGEHLLLRVPLEPAKPALLDVRGQVDADAMQACGTYITMISVSGHWMGNRTASVRPMKLSEAGANNAGGSVVHNFSMRLSSPGDRGSLAFGPWRQVSELIAGVPESLSVNMNASGVLMREEFGDHAEAQAFRFEFGEEERATMTISQASHQALNVQLMRMAALGEHRLGGLLGTERHSTIVSEPSGECKAYKAPQNSSMLRGIQAWRLRASWH